MASKSNRKLDLIRAAQAGVRAPNVSRLVEVDPKARLCACGCGSAFTPKRPHQRFISTKHRFAAWARNNPRVKASGD